MMDAPLGGSTPTEAIGMWFKSLAELAPDSLSALNLATLRGLKMREALPYQVQYVTLQDTNGQDWHGSFLLQQFAEQWYVKTGDVRPAISEQEPLRLKTRPWVRLESLAIGQSFEAFGEVFEQGIALGRARLLDGTDFVLEDTVEHGIVLFVADTVPTVSRCDWNCTIDMGSW